MELPFIICDAAQVPSDPRPAAESSLRFALKQERLFPTAASPHVLLLLPFGLGGQPAAQELSSLQGSEMLQALTERRAASALLEAVATVRPAAAALLPAAKVSASPFSAASEKSPSVSGGGSEALSPRSLFRPNLRSSTRLHGNFFAANSLTPASTPLQKAETTSAAPT